MAFSAMKLLGKYLSDLRLQIGSQLPFAMFLVLFGALLEGIGVLAIVPLIALVVGDNALGLESSPLFAHVEGILGAIGLDSDFELALLLAAGFIALIGVRNLIVWKRDTTLFRLKFRYVDAWRTDLFKAIARASWDVVSSLRRTDMEHAINTDVVRLSTGTDVVLRGAVSFALISVYCAVLFLLEPTLVLLALGLTAVSLLLSLPLLRSASKLGHQLTWSGAKKQKVLNQFMAAQKLARTSNAQAEFMQTFDDAVAVMRYRQLDFNRSQQTARGLFQFGGAFVVTCALLIGYFVFDTPIVLLAAMVLVLARLVSPVENLARMAQQMAFMLPAFDSLSEKLDLLKRSAAENHDVDARSSGKTGPAKLELKNISFKFQDNDRHIIKDLSVVIEPGQTLVIRGKSGAGKTTLLDIVTGLRRVSDGQILVDNALVSTDTDFAKWREDIAYLPQDPFLLDASLRENLAWLNGEVSDEEMWQALEIANAADIHTIQEQGLDYRTGERGSKLSGGECQRICLARALLRKPRLLVLDEATSGLDAQTEELLLNRISQLVSHCSILLVTHRDQALNYADKVLTFSDNGAILDSAFAADRHASAVLR